MYSSKPLQQRDLLHAGRIADALAEMIIRWVIRESPELVLDSLGERGIGDDGVLCLFIREVRVEVGDIEDGFDAWLEGGWVPLVEESVEMKQDKRIRDKMRRECGYVPVPVDVFCEERMPLDLLPTICPETLRRIPLQESNHHTARLRRHVRREVEWVGEDALVHRVDILIVERWESSLWSKIMIRKEP